MYRTEKNGVPNPGSEQYVHSNPNTLLLISRGLAQKDQKLVLTLTLYQEPKNVKRPREIRLLKGLRGWGLTKKALGKTNIGKNKQFCKLFWTGEKEEA